MPFCNDLPVPYNSFAMYALLALTLFLYTVIADKVINKWEGWLLLLAYALIMGNLIMGNPEAGIPMEVEIPVP